MSHLHVVITVAQKQSNGNRVNCGVCGAASCGYSTYKYIDVRGACYVLMKLSARDTELGLQDGEGVALEVMGELKTNIPQRVF